MKNCPVNVYHYQLDNVIASEGVLGHKKISDLLLMHDGALMPQWCRHRRDTAVELCNLATEILQNPHLKPRPLCI